MNFLKCAFKHPEVFLVKSKKGLGLQIPGLINSALSHLNLESGDLTPLSVTPLSVSNFD